MSCAGNGYLSGNMLVAYPIEDGQRLPWPDGSPDEAQMMLQRCVVDAGVFVNSGSVQEEGWPSIGLFSIGESHMEMWLSAAGSQERIYVNSVDESRSRFPVCSGSAAWGTYVVTLSTEGIRGFRDFCASNEISPPGQGSSPALAGRGLWLRLSPRCVTFRPATLTSLKVYDGVTDISLGPRWVISGDVRIKPGYNMMLSKPYDDEAGIALNAVAGAGLGRVPCDCRDDAVATVPQIISPDGHSRLFNDTCYDIEPVIHGSHSASLYIHAKCTSCCTCDMYASIVNDKLALLHRRLMDAKSELDGYLAQYEDGVGKFNRRLEKVDLKDVTLSLTGMRTGVNLGSNLSDTGVTGKMGRCAFSAVLRNSAYFPVKPRITFMYGTDEIVEFSAAWSDEEGEPLSMTGDSISGILSREFIIYPGRSLVVNFVSVKSQMVAQPDNGKYKGTIWFTVTYDRPEGGTMLLGDLKKTVEVCNDNEC